MSEASNIVLDWTPGRNGTGTLTARLGSDVLAAEKIDLLRPNRRAEFVARLAAGRPGIDRAAMAAELLRLAGDAATKPEPADAGPAELDVSRIVRPELFHTPDLSGVAVPAVRLRGGQPAGRWALYLHWHADGRREQRELESSIDMPDGRRLWFHPVPGEPDLTTRPGWSAQARAAWLAGADAPDAVDVLTRLCERFAYFLDFPPDVAEGTVATLALWTLLTYCYPAWTCLPYLAVGGPLASGKSTLFHVLARLVFRPLESSNMTAPCLFRTLHERGGVLLLDEAERLRDRAPEASDLRSILLSGYKRGSPAIRLEPLGDGRFKRVAFDVFGPKALACIGGLPESLASRCIRVSMFRADTESPKPRRRIDEDPARWAGLRDDLHALALEHGPIWLALAADATCCPATLNGRDFELWQPLFALAAWLESRGAGGLVRVLTEHVARSIEAAHDDAVPDADELLLKLLAEHVADGSHRALKAGDLLRQAREADPVTFARWSPKGVGAALARYGPRTRKGTGNTGRTYAAVTLADLRRVQLAYGFDLGLPYENVPQVPQPMPDSAVHAARCGTCAGGET